MSELLDQLVPKGGTQNTSFGGTLLNWGNQVVDAFNTSEIGKAMNLGFGNAPLPQSKLNPYTPPPIHTQQFSPVVPMTQNTTQGLFSPVQGMAPQSVSVPQGNTASMNTGFSPVTSITPQSNITGNNPANLSMQGWGNYNEPTQMRGIGNGSVGAGNGPATPPPTPGLWDTIGGMEGVAQGLGALGGIGETVLGFQKLGLAEDQFSFTKNAWQQDYNMRLKDYNRKVSRQDAKEADLSR